MFLIIRGNSFIPQRFWECELVTEQTLTSLRAKGANPVAGLATNTEIQRFEGREGTTVCLGDIADQFFNRGD
jgi:hypothetical protein